MINNEHAPERPPMSGAKQAKPRRAVQLVLASSLLITAGTGLLWWQRANVAEHFIEKSLAQYNVPASYTITHLNPMGAKLDNVTLGDTHQPDFTAKHLNIGLDWTWRGPRIAKIGITDAMLHAKYDDKGLHLGSLDALRPAPTDDTAFSLPDISLALDNAQLALATPFGAIGATLNGNGHLAHNFKGKFIASAPFLTEDDCSLKNAGLASVIRIKRRTIALKGPVKSGQIICSDLKISTARADFSIKTPETFATLDADIFTLLNGITASKKGQLSQLTAQTQLHLKAPDQTAPNNQDNKSNSAATQLALQGDITSQLQWLDLTVDTTLRRSLQQSAQSLTATPAGPLADKFTTALAHALESSRGNTGIAIQLTPDGRTVARLGDTDLLAKTGANFIGSGTLAHWQREQNGQSRFLPGKSRMTLSGGGLPNLSFASDISQQDTVEKTAGSAWQIVGEISPYKAGNAQLGTTPFTLKRQSGSTAFATELMLDGPVGDGMVKGLRLPINLTVGEQGDIQLFGQDGCLTAHYTSLNLSGLKSGKQNLTLCNQKRGNSPLVTLSADGVLNTQLNAKPFKFSGQWNDAPVTLEIAGATVSAVGKSNNPAIKFSTGAVNLQMPTADGETWLRYASLSGQSDPQKRIRGTVSKIAGAIGPIPLILEQSDASWQIDQQGLTLKSGAAHISDAEADKRFEPVIARALNLRLHNGIITGNAYLTRPTNDDRLANVTLRHRLADTSGEAILDVPQLTFGDRLQPEALTPLTLGIIANVGGTINGRGTIRWAEGAVTSDGTFETPGIGLSAAFGQIHNIKGKIVFDDLLGMTTPPGQTVTLGEINTGLSLKDGIISYRLLPERVVQLEEGAWKFAGGDLILEPSLLDFGKPSDRLFTLKVIGLDAALFIEQYNFRNFAASGTFDGKLPLLFNDEGGRIVSGRLVARRPGGNLAYVGELSEADLGGAGKMAFDALKSLKYNALIIEIDGDIDGEIVSNILFSGVNQNPVNPSGGALPVVGTGFPFRFNIAVKAPFRALLNTAESFTDVSSTVKSSLPPDTSAVPGAGPVIQPSEISPQ